MEQEQISYILLLLFGVFLVWKIIQKFQHEKQLRNELESAPGTVWKFKRIRITSVHYLLMALVLFTALMLSPQPWYYKMLLVLISTMIIIHFLFEEIVVRVNKNQVLIVEFGRSKALENIEGIELGNDVVVFHSSKYRNHYEFKRRYLRRGEWLALISSIKKWSENRDKMAISMHSGLK